MDTGPRAKQDWTVRWTDDGDWVMSNALRAVVQPDEAGEVPGWNDEPPEFEGHVRREWRALNRYAITCGKRIADLEAKVAKLDAECIEMHEVVEGYEHDIERWRDVFRRASIRADIQRYLTNNPTCCGQDISDGVTYGHCANCHLNVLVSAAECPRCNTPRREGTSG